ncbi:MAG: twin-arginine translocation signal domain-containing protein, partial [Anaerolineaceae bacterium]|nr:twin-arginine translocation signal domain-containing protein [Anaerolineaceae bacterium]
MATNISRRDFLKGIAAGAVSVGAAGALQTIAGPATAFADDAAVTPEEAIKVFDKIPQAYLNPQL